MRVLAAGFGLPEAPVWHDGAVWVSDVVNGGVHRLDGDVRREFLPGRRGIGGMVVTDNARIVATGRDLVDVATGKAVWVPPADCTGINDAGTDADGALLAGLLRFRPSSGEPPRPGRLVRLVRGQAIWEPLVDISWPNGIAGTPDGSVVLADFADGRLWRIAPGAPECLAVSPSGQFDGLACDSDGGIWVATGAGGTVVRLSGAGAMLAELPVPADFVSSVCFADAGTLIVTCAGCHLTADRSGAVLAHRVGVAGQPITPARL